MVEFTVPGMGEGAYNLFQTRYSYLLTLSDAQVYATLSKILRSVWDYYGNQFKEIDTYDAYEQKVQLLVRTIMWSDAEFNALF